MGEFIPVERLVERKEGELIQANQVKAGDLIRVGGRTEFHPVYRVEKILKPRKVMSNNKLAWLYAGWWVNVKTNEGSPLSLWGGKIKRRIGGAVERGEVIVRLS